MAYVKLENGVVSVFPYTLEQLSIDYPNTFFADGDFSSVDVYPVTVQAVPEYDDTAVEIKLADQPILTDGVWVQPFVSIPLSDERKAEAIGRRQAAFIKGIVDATSHRLNTFVATRAYDSVDSISKYKDLTEEDIALIPEVERVYVVKFRAEARYISLTTARTWAKLYTILDDVNSGARPAPASFAEIEAELPVLDWSLAV